MFSNLPKCVAAFLLFYCTLLAGCPTPGPSACVPGETQACACAGGGTGVQTCSSSGSSWGACVGCSSSSSPDAGTSTTCRPPGVPVLACGCWGPAVEGQVVRATGCCSGWAVQTRCTGFCPGGGSSWGNVCQ